MRRLFSIPSCICSSVDDVFTVVSGRPSMTSLNSSPSGCRRESVGVVDIIVAILSPVVMPVDSPDSPCGVLSFRTTFVPSSRWFISFISISVCRLLGCSGGIAALLFSLSCSCIIVVLLLLACILVALVLVTVGSLLFVALSDVCDVSGDRSHTFFMYSWYRSPSSMS